MMHQLRCLTIMQSASRDGDAAGDTHTGGGSAPTHDDAVARSSKRARTESGPSDAVVEASHSGATVLTDEQCYAKFRVLNPKFVYLVRSSRSSPRVAQLPQTVSSGGPYIRATDCGNVLGSTRHSISTEARGGCHARGCSMARTTFCTNDIPRCVTLTTLWW